MGFLDAILGRSKPVRPDLDQLFALPSAAVTLQAASGFVPTGRGSVCFASVEGGAFARIQEEARSLLDGSVEFTQDAYGYTWLLVRHPPEDVAGLVNDLHAVNTSLEEAGFGPSCCVRWSASGRSSSGRWRWSTSTSAARSTPSRRSGRAARSATTRSNSRCGRCSGTI
ncbi:hypothetical protein Srufu_038370 [Streptomyces libani subsp. rufus]|nr:hypothetical protein Srufu_038370 [Streptomyces libani subsp. rufus]